MSYASVSIVGAVALSGAMLLALEIGRRVGTRRLAADPEGARTGLATVDGAVFALLGLLVAFTFSGAAGRLDQRRALIAEEVNAIGTAWLRIDLLPAESQPGLRDLFRRYLDSRLEAYRLAPTDVEAALAEWDRGVRMQSEIWQSAVAASRAEPSARILVLPSLNAMFDIVTTRRMALDIHPPPVVFAMLFALSVACALLAGYGMAGGHERSWTHMLVFAAVIGLTVYVILDLEYPRIGLIRLDAADRLLIELRGSMS